MRLARATVPAAFDVDRPYRAWTRQSLSTGTRLCSQSLRRLQPGRNRVDAHFDTAHDDQQFGFIFGPSFPPASSERCASAGSTPCGTTRYRTWFVRAHLWAAVFCSVRISVPSVPHPYRVGVQE